MGHTTREVRIILPIFGKVSVVSRRLTSSPSSRQTSRHSVPQSCAPPSYTGSYHGPSMYSADDGLSFPVDPGYNSYPGTQGDEIPQQPNYRFAQPSYLSAEPPYSPTGPSYPPTRSFYRYAEPSHHGSTEPSDNGQYPGGRAKSCYSQHTSHYERSTGDGATGPQPQQPSLGHDEIQNKLVEGSPWFWPWQARNSGNFMKAHVVFLTVKVNPVDLNSKDHGKRCIFCDQAAVRYLVPACELDSELHRSQGRLRKIITRVTVTDKPLRDKIACQNCYPAVELWKADFLTWIFREDPVLEEFWKLLYTARG